MSFKKKLLPLALAQIIAGGAFSAIIMAPAMAQEATSDTQPVQRIEITGSNIRRADAETPSPVQVITADDLKKSGFTSIQQVLQNITANGQGTLTNASPNSFATGASGIALRGLDTAATLVLIDGHRMAPYPLPDNAQFSFVDISNIPFDTIERVEILKDGASAVYGSDAEAGVVNIILKKNFVGTKINAEGAGTTEGGGATAHASIIHGFGDLDTDGYNAYGSLEYRHSDAIAVDQRVGDGLWAGTNLTSIGGVNKTPGVIGQVPNPNTQSPYLLGYNAATGTVAPLTSAVFGPGSTCTTAQLNNPATGCPAPIPNQLQPETQNINLLASFTKNLSDGWKFNAKASLFDGQSTQIQAYQVFPQSYAQGSAQGGLAVSANQAPTLVGSGSIGNITVPANYQGLGQPTSLVYGVIPGLSPLTDTLESKAMRLVGDLNGTIGAWDIATSLGWTKVGTSQDFKGTLDTPALAAMLANGSFNIYGGNSAATLAAISPAANSYDTSLLEFGEFHASRSLMTLPGGDLGFSTGFAYIHRDLESPSPLLSSDGTIAAIQGNAYSSGVQNDASAYLEFVAPVLKTLEVDTDARFDHFNQAGNAETGKLAFKWTPTDSFALRGSASNGFRAPNPSESGKAGATFIAQGTNDPVYCPGGLQGNGNPPAGAVISAAGNNLCNYTPITLEQSNPALKPERSTSFTLGTILEPIKGWSTTIDMYKITIRDQIVSPAVDYTTAVPNRTTTPVVATCSDGTATGTEPCTTPVYPVTYYTSNYINANSTMTSGVELGTHYKFKLGDYGTLKAELDWTHIFSYVYSAGGMSYQMVGTHGPIIISNDTGNPQDRVQAIFTWDKGPLEIATSFNWIGSYNLLDSSVQFDTCAEGALGNQWFGGTTTPLQGCTVGSFLDTDLFARYNVNKQLSVHASVTDLFNQAPPLDVATYGSTLSAYNPALHQVGAIGRTINVGATYSF